MNFTITRQALTNALALVTIAVPTRPSVPILSGILINATFGGVTFRATDWDTFATADVDADVTAQGTCVVSARVLAEWLKNMPKRAATFAFTLTDGCTLRIAGNDSNGTGYRDVPTMPVEDFPADIEAVSGLGSVTLIDLVAGIKATAPAASTDVTLPGMCAINMRADGHTLHMDATDRYRLASADVTWSPAGHGNDWGALPDVRTLVKMCTALGKIAGRKLPGELTIGARYSGYENAFFGVTYAAGDGAVYTLKIRSLDNASFPPVRSLYPAKAETTVTVDGSALSALVDQVTAGAERGTILPVILTFDGATVTAEFGESESVPGEPAARGDMPTVALVDGPAVTAGFRPSYLVATVKALGGGNVTLSLVDGFKPVVIAPADGDGTMRHLVMPIRTVGRDVRKPAATAPAAPADQADTVPAVTEPHAYKSFGGSSARRCGVPGCDRGKTARIHAVPAGEPAATAPAEPAAPADQVDTVPAVTGDQVATDGQGDAEPAAPAVADQVATDAPALAGEVRALIAAGSWNLEHVLPAKRRKGSRVMLYVFRPMAGRLPRETFRALADQLESLGSYGWNGNARGFTFATGDSGNPWRKATPSGRERVATWLAETADQVATDAPAVDDQADPVPADFAPYTEEIRGCRCTLCATVAGAVRAGEPFIVPARALLSALVAGEHVRDTGAGPALADQVDAPAVAEPADQVDAVSAPRGLVDARALALVTGVVPDAMPARILPAGVLATMPHVPCPDDFKPYRDQISGGCECALCHELSANGHHFSDKHVQRQAARVLLAHLVAGTHERVTIAEVAAFARTAKAARLDAARAAGASAETLATIERGYATVKMSDFYATGMGLGIGNAPIEAERAERLARESESAVTAPVTVDQGDTVPDISQADTVDQGGPTVHTFGDTGEAYDASQCRDEIRDGDILHVPSESVVGFLFQAWPTAVTVESGEFSGSADLTGIRGEGYGASIDAARALADSLGYALADVTTGTGPAVADQGDQVAERAPIVCDQADTVPAVEPARIVYVTPAPAPTAPAVAEPAEPVTGPGHTYGAHPQRVHVSGIGEGDGYRFHLVAGANGRALAKLVKPALARLIKETGARFYVTAPRGTGTVNVVPHSGNTVTNWAPALALFADMIGEHIAHAAECGACDRAAALVDA